jgi:DNA replication regulator DPB11
VFVHAKVTNSGGMFWQDEGDEREREKYRTECWVERCIFEERICAPDEHVVFTPLKINTPVEGALRLFTRCIGVL